jgi:hypothetical protein
MGWFSKKENKTNVEQMPQLPELPDSPHTNILIHEGVNPPQIPSPIRIQQEDKISLPEYEPPQRLVRKISDEDFKPQYTEPKPGMQKSKFSSDYPMPSIPDYTPIQKVENYPEPKIKNESYKPLSESPRQQISQIKTFPKKDESVFIRIDKFQVTIEAFRDISQKIREIEELLARTKEIKAREEKELEEWEREIEAIKLKLDSIGKEISIPDE